MSDHSWLTDVLRCMMIRHRDEEDPDRSYRILCAMQPLMRGVDKFDKNVLRKVYLP